MVQGLKDRLRAAWNEVQAINGRLADRTRRWDALYRAGGGQAYDYIRADFNTDNPAGLDTQPWPEQKIEIKGLSGFINFHNPGDIVKIPQLTTILGFVQNGKDTSIFIYLHQSYQAFTVGPPVARPLPYS